MSTGYAYVYVWEYRVAPDRLEAFLRSYGSEGDWVRLFRRAAGYVRTELLQDRADPRRFLTIDYWDSEAAWNAFRSGFAKEYAALDARCAQLTTREDELGRFRPIA